MNEQNENLDDVSVILDEHDISSSDLPPKKPRVSFLFLSVVILIVIGSTLIYFNVFTGNEVQDESISEEKTIPVDPISPSPQNFTGRLSSEIVDEIFNTPPGRITNSEAQALIIELIASEDFKLSSDKLLSSNSITERLLGVFSILTESGLTNELRILALSDPSPYVRAEIINFLFLNKDFDALTEILNEYSSMLAVHDAVLIAKLSAVNPKADVPVAFSRLDIGEGLLIYVKLLAGVSDVVKEGVLTVLKDMSISRNGRNDMLSILASAKPDDYLSILKEQFLIESELAVRIQIAQHIAALTPESDIDTSNLLQSRMPSVLPGLSPVHLIYNEERLDRLDNYSIRMTELIKMAQVDQMKLYMLLSLYITEGEMVGLGNLSADLLQEVVDFLEEKQQFIDPDIDALAQYIRREID